MTFLPYSSRPPRPSRSRHPTHSHRHLCFSSTRSLRSLQGSTWHTQVGTGAAPHHTATWLAAHPSKASANQKESLHWEPGPYLERHTGLRTTASHQESLIISHSRDPSSLTTLRIVGPFNIGATRPGCGSRKDLLLSTRNGEVERG